MNEQPQNSFALQTKQQQSREVEYVPFGGGDKIKLSVAIIQNLIATPTRTGKTCSERDAMKFLMLCRSLGLNPFTNDAYLVGYDGQDGPTFSLITAHQAFLKRAELHPEYDGMESGVIVSPALACPMCQSNGGREVSGNWLICSACKGIGQTDEVEGDLVPEGHQLIGGWAKVHFKNRKIPTKRRVSLKAFDSQRSRWKVDAAGMICKVAEADSLRSSFPTKLGGLYLREEQDIPTLTAERATDLHQIAQASQPTRRRNPEATELPPTGINNRQEPPDDVLMSFPTETGSSLPPDRTDVPADPGMEQDKPAPKKREPKLPKEQPPTSPVDALKALIATGNYTQEEVIEAAVKKFGAAGVNDVSQWQEPYIVEVVENWRLLAQEVKTIRLLKA